MLDLNKYKFKAAFSSNIRILPSKEFDSFLSLASSELLKGLIPEEVRGDNIDLLPFCGPACNVGFANLNHDLIAKDTALKIYKQFIHKPINLEHKRTSEIKGHVVSAGFSEFLTDKPLTKDELKDKEIFNISIAGVFYRVVDEDFTNLMEASSDPSSIHFGIARLSWELFYNDYKIMLDSKNISEGEIIDDSKKIEELSKFLPMLGGSGKTDDGREVYKLIFGEVIPVGLGITSSPAAKLSPIYVEQDKEDNDKKEIKSNIDNPQSNISQNNKSTVINIEQFNTEKIMTIKNIKDLTDESLKQVAASAIIDLWETEIKRADDKFKAEKDEKQRAYAELEKKNADVFADLEKTKKEFEDLNKKFTELSNQAQAKEAQEKFTQRMAHFDAEYELSDEDRLIVKEDIQGLEDKKFDAYAKRMEVLFREKNKKVIAEKAKKEAEAKEKKEAKASTETPVKDAVDAAKKEVQGTVPNASDNTNQTLFDKYKAAFSPENCIQGFPVKK